MDTADFKIGQLPVADERGFDAESCGRLIGVSHRMFGDEWLNDIFEVLQTTADDQISALQRYGVVRRCDSYPA